MTACFEMKPLTVVQAGTYWNSLCSLGPPYTSVETEHTGALEELYFHTIFSVCCWFIVTSPCNFLWLLCRCLTWNSETIVPLYNRKPIQSFLKSIRGIACGICYYGKQSIWTARQPLRIFKYSSKIWTISILFFFFFSPIR